MAITQKTKDRIPGDILTMLRDAYPYLHLHYKYGKRFLAAVGDRPAIRLRWSKWLENMVKPHDRP